MSQERVAGLLSWTTVLRETAEFSRHPHPPFGDLTDTWDMCTIGSNRAGEKLVCSLTSEEEVVGRWGGAARGGSTDLRFKFEI